MLTTSSVCHTHDLDLTAYALKTDMGGGLPGYFDVRDYGAVGDGVHDDTPAIAAAITAAATHGVVFLPVGTYKVTSMLTVDAGALIGVGNWNPEQTYGPASCLLAGTAGMTVIRASAQSRLMDFAIQGADLANYGVRFDSTARPFAQNLAVMRCRKSSYLFAQTQNGTYINLYSHFSACGFLLANGCRNNNFYNATSETYEGIYSYTGTPFAQTANIRYVIDTNDPDMGEGVWTNGNDRNNWFGGIHERAGTALVFQNRSAFAGAEATNNQFYGVEFTSPGSILDTSASVSPGYLDFDACSFAHGTDQSKPWGVGTTGHVRFDGYTYFSGGNDLSRRGITQDSDYVSLFSIDTDKYRAALTDDAGTTTFDPATRIYTHTGGNDILGVAFRSSEQPSNSTSDITVTKGGGFHAQVTFTLTKAGSAPVLVYIPSTAAPWRRQIASVAANGTYTYLVRFASPDIFNVSFAPNGNASFTVRGLVVKAL